jgi:hypothetical protein
MDAFDRRLAVLASVVLFGALSLAGCGGGGGDTGASDPSAPEVVAPSQPEDSRPTANQEQLPVVTVRCGVDSFDEFGATGIQTGSYLATFDGGVSKVVGYVASGDYFDTSVRMDVRVPQTDYRPASPPVDMDRRMGVAMNGPYLVGSLACIKSVAHTEVNGGNQTLVWASDAYPQLPVNLVTGTPVAGFEFFGNFEAGSPTVYFELDAAGVSRPNDMSVCSISGTNTWSCVVPHVGYDGSVYSFSTPVQGHGVYLLVEAPAPV